MKILFVGHRLQDLGGFEENDLQRSIRQVITSIVQNDLSSRDVILTSLGLGIESWAIAAAWELDTMSDNGI